MKSTSKLTYSALLVGLSVVFMWLSAFFPTLSLTIVAVAGILIISVLIECGYRYAILTYFAVSILSLLLVTDRVNVVFYIFILGSYPIIKSVFERIKISYLSYIIKLLYCILLLIVLYLFFKGIVSEFIPTNFSLLPTLLIGGLVFFVVYDMALTKLVVYYLQFIHPKLKRF